VDKTVGVFFVAEVCVLDHLVEGGQVGVERLGPFDGTVVEHFLHSPDKRCAFADQELDAVGVLVQRPLFDVHDDVVGKVFVFDVRKHADHLGAAHHPVEGRAAPHAARLGYLRQRGARERRAYLKRTVKKLG
jgi:hypothetical protein